MQIGNEGACHLLQLPISCLLAVMGHLADDPGSLACAAGAHRRLHREAVLVLANKGVFPLLQLPDHGLLAVMGQCADDLRSLFSAARAHSRLQQAAVQ